MAEPYPKNVPGPFYIENTCCLTCGEMHDAAPGLFDWDQTGEHAFHCFVSRQPETPAEIAQMIIAMDRADMDCIRYRGDDPDLRLRLIQAGHADHCD